MALMFQRENPRDIAEEATMAGRLHDVVFSVSKAIHGRGLDEEDRDALRFAKSLLESVASTHAVADVPSANQLNGPSDPVVVLRQITTDEPTVWKSGLTEFSKAIASVLKGERNDGLVSTLESIRTIFMMVSRAILGAEVKVRADDSFGAWPHSMMNSTS
jgi:hypothetical protein